jgi:hypothetical protein
VGFSSSFLLKVGKHVWQDQLVVHGKPYFNRYFTKGEKKRLFSFAVFFWSDQAPQ